MDLNSFLINGQNGWFTGANLLKGLGAYALGGPKAVAASSKLSKAWKR